MRSWRNAMGLFDPWNDDGNDDDDDRPEESNAGRGFDTGWSVVWDNDTGKDDHGSGWNDTFGL